MELSRGTRACDRLLIYSLTRVASCHMIGLRVLGLLPVQFSFAAGGRLVAQPHAPSAITADKSSGRSINQ